jgi:hypothetical protein
MGVPPQFKIYQNSNLDTNILLGDPSTVTINTVENVKRGSIIYSDSWCGQRRKNLEDEGCRPTNDLATSVYTRV